MATQPLILTELRSVTNTNIVIGNREQSSGSMTIILLRALTTSRSTCISGEKVRSGFRGGLREVGRAPTNKTTHCPKYFLSQLFVNQVNYFLQH